MTREEIQKYRQSSSQPINKSIKSKDARERFVLEIIKKMDTHLSGIDDAVDRGDIVVPSLKDLCREMGIRTYEFMALINEFPELERAYENFMATIETNIEDMVAKKAQMGDMSAISFYHKNYSNTHKKHEKLRKELGLKYLEELKSLKDSNTLSASKIRDQLVRKLLEMMHIESATGSTVTAVSIARELASILNLAEIMEGNENMDHLTPHYIRKLVYEKVSNVSHVDDATIIQAAEDSPEYAKMFPTDNEMGKKLRNMVEAKHEKR